MWTPHALLLPAVGSLIARPGKATTKDANAASKTVKYNLDTIFRCVFGPAEMITMQSYYVLLFNEDQLQGREASSRKQ